jgi:WD40 repeat protein
MVILTQQLFASSCDVVYLYTIWFVHTLLFTTVWDLRNASYSRSFHVGAGVTSVALRMDRDEFISGDQNGNVKMFDLGGRGCINSVRPSAAGSTPLRVSETPSPLHETTENSGSGTTNRRKRPLYYSEGIAPIQAVDISEDSRTLVAVSNRGTVFAWDPSGRGMTNHPIHDHPHLHHDGGHEDNEHLTVESLLRPITKFRAHAPGTYCLHAKIAPDCRHLVTTGRYVTTVERIRTFSTFSQRPPIIFWLGLLFSKFFVPIYR